jgi:branched-chain amino acid transport system substrate-binding protein
VYTVDEISIPAVKDAAVGIYETRYWSPDLKNAANSKFVTDYKKKYGKLPVFYGAQAYDSILLIDSAVKATKGNLKDTQALVKEMRKANFNSLRGPFTYNVNHHPIQNFYLLRAEKTSGGDIEMKIQKTIFEKHKDSYYQDCKMKW